MDTRRDGDTFLKRDSNDKIFGNVKRDDPFYNEAREQTMQEYLNDVGPISQYINEQMDQLAKDRGGREK